jgi:hypothetical protein
MGPIGNTDGSGLCRRRDRIARGRDIVVVMIRSRGWVIAWIATATAAGAQPAATPEAVLVAQGEQLARTGEFSRAIVAFKQAEQLRPSAANACRIGLAYTRRELWSQAELFFARCKARATAADPTPPWLDAAETALTSKLAEIDAAPIDVRVDAPGALISISSFPPDEKFAPRAIHLSPGNYTIVASAPDREPATVAIAVEARTAQIVTLVLPHPPPPPPPPPTRDQKIGRVLLFTAAGAAVVGVAAHALAAYERSQLDDARTANDPVAWDRRAGNFERDRAIAIGGYTVAVAAAITGAILHSHGPETAPMLTGAGDAHGASVGLEWRR